jgi:hypothetical protein
MPRFLTKKNNIFLILAVFFLARVINHPPNFTPQIIFGLYLSSVLSKVRAILVILILMALTDLFLFFSQGYSLGSWIVFTYSGLFIIILFAPRLKPNSVSFILNGLIATLGYWVWTNFGTWLTSGMYIHNKDGLILCYSLALPFLKNSMLAAFLWSYLLANNLKIIQKAPIASTASCQK